MFPSLSLSLCSPPLLRSNTAASPLPPLIIPPHLSPIFAFLSSTLCPIPSVPKKKKAGLSFLAFQRYKLGADSALFSQEYTDPSQDAAGAPYTSFGGDDVESPGGGGGAGGQANSDGAFDGTSGYQRQDY